MRKIFLFFFLVLPLFGVELISYNIYDRKDRVDVMLSFDGTYDGNISQKTEKNRTLLTLSNVKYSKKEQKDLSSDLVDKIWINSQNDETYIMFQNKTKVNLSLSSINDKFGVRIRVTGEDLNRSSANPSNASASGTRGSSNELKSKDFLGGYDFTNYILVLVVLMFLLVGLWWLKRIVGSKGSSDLNNFNVVFQRPLDKNNQFMVLDYKSKRYVMIIGVSNLLLESAEIAEDELQKDKEEDFNFLFEENKKKIQDLIQKRQKTKVFD